MAAVAPPRCNQVPSHILRILTHLKKVGLEEGCNLTFELDRSDYIYFEEEIESLRSRYLLSVRIFYILPEDVDDAEDADTPGFFIEFIVVNPMDDELTDEELEMYPQEPDMLEQGDLETCHKMYGVPENRILNFLRRFLSVEKASEITTIDRIYCCDSINIPN